MTDTTPPAATDLELAVVASLIFDPTNVDRVSTMITAADFHDADVGKLFAALVDLHEAGQPINDVRLLRSELPRMGVAAEVCDGGFLGSVGFNHPQHHHARFYAHHVRRAATLRRLLAFSEQLEIRTKAADADPNEVTAWLEGQLAGIHQQHDSDGRTIGEVATSFLDSLDNPQAIGKPIFTGIAPVDEATGGICPGELCILAARPGCGKSALAMQWAVYQASKETNVLFVSLEMSEAELTTRELCSSAGVDTRDVRQRDLTDRQRHRLRQAAGELAGLPLTIRSPASATLSRIRAFARQQHAKRPLGLLVVDYLQLIRPESDQRKLPRYEQVTAVSAGLKILARELSVPVLCLAQLNREADGNEPRLSHLRESGSIEQDADMVLFLHREKDAAGDTPGETLFIVGKHRHGETGRLKLEWRPRQMRFAEISARNLPNYEPVFDQP